MPVYQRPQRRMLRSSRLADHVTMAKNAAKLIRITVSCLSPGSCVTAGKSSQTRNRTCAERRRRSSAARKIEPVHVALEHLDPREHVMAQRHRDRALEVRVRRQR